MYTIRLKITYTRRTWDGLDPIDTPNYVQELAVKTVLASVHPEVSGARIYAMVYRNEGGSADEDTRVTFGALAQIDYAKEIPEAYSGPDHFSGVRPGSVQYRWKIVRPSGYVEYEEPDWTTISGANNEIAPFVHTFVTPLWPNQYKVILQIKYKELRWKKVSYSGVGISWVDDPSYMENSVYKTCPEVPTNAPIRANPSDLLLSGQTPFSILINDCTPATIAIESGPSAGTTGDPLQNPEVIVQVTDNNPYCEFTNPILIEDRYVENSKAVTREQENGSALSIGDPIRAVSATARVVVDSKTGEAIEGSRARFQFEFCQSLNYKTKMPDDYAVTMADYGVGCPNGPLNYKARVEVKDGYKPVFGKDTYSVFSSANTVTVSDNDAPELDFTVRLTPPFFYKVTGGVHDLPHAPAKIDLDLNGNKFPAADDPFKMNPPQVLEVESFVCKVYAGQRIAYSLKGNDNVDGAIASGSIQCTAPVFSSSGNSFFIFEKVPQVNPAPCLIELTDKAGNKRTIKFFMQVNELGFDPRVLESKTKGEK